MKEGTNVGVLTEFTLTFLPALPLEILLFQIGDIMNND
jgi:hypothetical protein